KMIYDAVVEDINDPLKLGRVRVRVFGLHTDNTSLIPTEDLTWARVLIPGSASMSGKGSSPHGYLPGSWVMVAYQDAEQQYPIVLGAYAGFPGKNVDTTKANDELSFASVYVNTSPDTQASTGVYTPSATDVSLPSANDPYDLTGMPTTAPTGTPSSTQATKNIGIIISACKSAGITSRRAISSVLGVIGGESLWIPTKENFNYSASRLVEVFPSVFPTVDDALPYANNPIALPEKLYGVGTSKGKTLGNTQVGDASRYVGRGFIQISGRYNYDRYGTLAGVDLINNPELLVSNAEISAKVAVAYVLDKVSTSQLSESYFDSVKNKVGYNTPDISIKKKRYYDYFMSGVDTSAGNNQTTNTTDPSKFNILKDNDPSVFSAKAGFQDPSGKYPLYVDEQDTSRLARREKLESTIVQKKNDNRV
ncbi:MAG TPA: glycoside hydrolase family 19 protein, partial [Methanosarcina sp.]|nr:glycoside hydrolase family 19 protein [Methanosarcina sp.]